MIFVIVRQKDIVIGKEAYGGDTSKIQEQLDARQVKDQTLSFEVFEEKEQDVFDRVVIPRKISPEQAEWQIEKAKGQDAAIVFLAKRLGLE